MLVQTLHIVKKQFLHVEVNGTESDGLTLQRRLPGLCEEGLISAIERALDRCAPTHGHLSIERLDIDAGTLSLQRLEHDLPELVGQALEKTLREHIPRVEQTPTISPGNVQLKTARQSLHEAFIYFLTTGSLPWSFRLPEGSNLEQVILGSWQEAETSGTPPTAVNDAVLRVLASATIRQRLIRQFSPVFLETLLSRLSSEGKTVMDGIVPVLRNADVPSGEIKYLEKQLWETIFAGVARGKILSASSLVAQAWSALRITDVQQTSLASLLERQWPGTTTKPPPASAKQFQGREPISPNIPVSKKPPLNISAQLEPGEMSERPGPGERSAQPDAEKGIYIENAGLVLLHPFLPQFFEGLGMVAEDRLTQPERAVCLLHFLITGQAIAPEYELVLPKILCNIPLDTPVESDVDLTDVEKEEATALLEAVIRHWEALRNTSPDGLRGTFLLRKGKVSMRDDGDWLLQVESNSFDILLDQLPWGISMIKLPWMDKMVWVEWR